MGLFLTNTQLLSSQDVNWWTRVVWITCGLLWCFYQLFGLSFWRHPFTAEHPLVSKWCNATFLQIWWRNKISTSWMAWGRVIFGWTIPLSLMSYETAVKSSSALSPSETNGTWGLSHKTSLPNKPGLFQLVWLILNQINWVRLSEINLAYLVNLFYETGPFMVMLVLYWHKLDITF